jgi:hypothetical protein
MDFFAGSGATGQAVIEANKDDKSSRKFILVQLPEPTENKAFPTIADITKERVRRVIQKLNEEEAGQLPLNGKPDRGFRLFKLAESNFKSWQAQASHDAQTLAQQLELHIDHLHPDRTSQDILYEILLKSAFPLTTKIETLKVSPDNRLVDDNETLKVSPINQSEGGQKSLAKPDEGQPGKPLGSEPGSGMRVFSVADGAMLICLEKTAHAGTDPRHGGNETAARGLSRSGLRRQRPAQNQCRTDF